MGFVVWGDRLDFQHRRYPAQNLYCVTERRCAPARFVEVGKLRKHELLAACLERRCGGDADTLHAMTVKQLKDVLLAYQVPPHTMRPPHGCRTYLLRSGYKEVWL